MRTLFALMLSAALAGCGGQAAPLRPTSRLVGPDAAVMVPRQPLPTPQKDEDAKQLLKECRFQYGHETDKLEPLQSFARRVTQSRQ